MGFLYIILRTYMYVLYFCKCFCKFACDGFQAFAWDLYNYATRTKEMGQQIAN